MNFSNSIEMEAWQAYLNDDFLLLSEIFVKCRKNNEIRAPFWPNFALSIVQKWKNGEMSIRKVDEIVASYLPLNQFRNDKIASLYLSLLCIRDYVKGIEYQCCYNTKRQLSIWYYDSLFARTAFLTSADAQIIQLISFEGPIDSPVIFHLVKLASPEHISLFLNRNGKKWNKTILWEQERLRKSYLNI